MSKPAMSALRIVIADPVPAMASLVATMLRSIGVRSIREIGDATRLMGEFEHHLHDVLVLDDALRDGSIDFVRRLRAATDCPARHIPIIMMSSRPDTARILEARDAGVNEFLRKPFSAKHLETRLDTILNAPRGFVEARQYTGPDRRRRSVDRAGDDRRKARPEGVDG